MRSASRFNRLPRNNAPRSLRTSLVFIARYITAHIFNRRKRTASRSAARTDLDQFRDRIQISRGTQPCGGDLQLRLPHAIRVVDVYLALAEPQHLRVTAADLVQ